MTELLWTYRRNPKKIYNYFLANYRTYIYHNLPFLMREHIKEQYIFRINMMDTQCLEEGMCKECGCKTPNLQFSNQSCEVRCYPEMMSKKKWKEYSDDPRIKEYLKIHYV